MNSILLAVILGIVEGVTEFLPVSSTAHLRITQYYLGISLEDEFWKLFAIFIQLGAILAVVAIYREKLKTFLKEASEQKSLLALIKHPLGLIAIAFFCTAIPAFLLSKLIGDHLESLSIVITSLAVGGVVMILVDLFFKNGPIHSMKELSIWKAAWIGVVQVLSAVFPGTSRSMSTIAAGQVVGLSRSLALEFSFFVSIPVMVAATSYDLLKYIKSSSLPLTQVLNAEQASALAVGFIVSYIVAFAVIRWFLQFVKKYGFFWFGLYRIFLAIFLFLQLH
ncbi:MAG: undecaprenyl-diphosphate phosphatase [Oligoflexia bacterium]|nr:undecaprenyl-diphosphate phosphatase [Oligoflexia bacterium]